jgi:hypothetical protein
MSEQKVTLTPEQKTANVKALLMQQMNQIYSALTRFVHTMPVDEKLKEFSIMNLDQGIMWAEQAIKKLNFKVEDPATEPTAPPAEPNAPAAPQEGQPLSAEEQTAQNAQAAAVCEQPTQPEGATQ